MTDLHLFSIHAISCGLFLIGGTPHTIAAEQRGSVAPSFQRQVKFELTFANQDVTWFGDPASPAALAYLKPGSRPIATDLCVTTEIENHELPHRRYFREARIAFDNNTRVVYAFTKDREKVIGAIDDQRRFLSNQFYEDNRELLSTWPADASVLNYDSKTNALYCEVELPGPLIFESLDFPPLELSDAEGRAVAGRFSIDYAPSNDSEDAEIVVLTLVSGEESIILAKAAVPKVFRRTDMKLCSFDSNGGTYFPESAYRPSASDGKHTEPSVTVVFAGEFTPAVRSNAESLIVVDAPQPVDRPKVAPTTLAIDGNFDDWRNLEGVNDPRGDVVSYLEYVPDVDLLEFKVAHDDQHIYLYARVAGQVGRSHPDGGRSYFYSYMDVDQNPGTGFLPTRDDDCYFGVDIGDDCEVQFEFVSNAFRKAFYGFCGLGGNENVLKQTVTIGKSQYGRFDANGVERANYKSEYTYRDGVTHITEDLQLGSSDTIRLAVSPDGSEVEVVSTFTGFLKDRQSRPTVRLGQTIDLAAGMECDSKAYPGKTRWAADSTIAIRGYRLTSQ